MWLCSQLYHTNRKQSGYRSKADQMHIQGNDSNNMQAEFFGRV